jgi:hypothetical protein
MLRSLILLIGISFISLFQFTTAYSQPLLSINGTVKDAGSGEVLIGASMYLLENPQKITLSNAYGFFSISAIPGNYQLVTLFAGYRSDTVSVQLSGNKTFVIKLKPIGKELEEVVEQLLQIQQLLQSCQEFLLM